MISMGPQEQFFAHLRIQKNGGAIFACLFVEVLKESDTCTETCFLLAI